MFVSWGLGLVLGLCVCGLVSTVYVIMHLNSSYGVSVGLFY